jgi:hypothetical protein
MFVQVAAISLGGEVAISAPINAGSTQPPTNHGFQVTGLVAATGITQYRIYFVTLTATAFTGSLLTGTVAFTVPAGIGTVTYNPGGSPPGLGGTLYPIRLANPAPGTRGALTRLLCYDLVLKAWTVMDLPFNIATLKQVRTPGSIPITVLGSFDTSSVAGATSPNTGGILRRIQAGDLNWDGSTTTGSAGTTPVSWSVRTAEVVAPNNSQRIYFRRVTVHGTTANSAGVQPMPTVNCVMTVDGNDQPSQQMIVYTQGTGQYEMQLDIGTVGNSAHATFSGAGHMELNAIEWMVEPLEVGVPVYV